MLDDTGASRRRENQRSATEREADAIVDRITDEILGRPFPAPWRVVGEKKARSSKAAGLLRAPSRGKLDERY